MKIAWVSVSPFAKTGYGRMTREIVSRLYEKYDVICVAHEADVVVWGGKKQIDLGAGKEVTVLSMFNPLISKGIALETLNTYIEKYGFDLIIAHWDAFALEFLNDVKLPWLAYIPIDGPMTEKWANYVKNAYRVIAYSHFGYNELLKFFPPARLAYIPHGVDTKVFRPLNKDKAELRQKIEAVPPIPEDCFLVLNVAANIGSRKKLPLLIRTFRRFVKYCPDAHLYLHTNAYAPMGKGYDLMFYVHMLGLDDKVHLPKYNPVLLGLSDLEMCEIYNAADVYVSNSVAEGFCLPLIEAQACGLPVIAPLNSAQEELVRGHGWLVRSVDPDAYVEIPVYVPQLTEYPVPDQASLLSHLIDAYNNRGLLEDIGKKARCFALQYDWDNVIPMWFKLLEEVENEISLFKSIIS